MNPLPITSAIAAMLAIVMFPLTLLVSLQRTSLGKAMGDIAGVGYGDGNDETLRRRIRAFGNFVEYVPLCLILLLLLELSSASSTFVWVIGGLLVVGRIIHAVGMLSTKSPAPRIIGMLLTYIAFVGPAIWLIVNVVV